MNDKPEDSKITFSDTQKDSKFTFVDTQKSAEGGFKSVELFTIMSDGTIIRGPGFTTVDEMSLKFWEAVEKTRRPLP
jgi:hypothetical protein